MNLPCRLAFALLLGLVTLAAQTNLFNPSTTAPVGKPPSAGSQPLEVSATGGGQFHLGEGYAIYRTNVQAHDPQFFLSCDQLRFDLDLKPKRGTNQPATNPLTAASPFAGGIRQVRQVEALGNVVFSNKLDFSQAYADRVTYSATNDVFELTGNARVITSGITNRATKILFHRTTRLFEAIGNLQTEGSIPASTKPTKPAKTP